MAFQTAPCKKNLINIVLVAGQFQGKAFLTITSYRDYLIRLISLTAIIIGTVISSTK